MCARTDGEYDRRSLLELSWRPACLSRYDAGGAKSIGEKTIESSFNMCGVGSVRSAAGGGIGFLGPDALPCGPVPDVFEVDEKRLARGGMSWLGAR